MRPVVSMLLLLVVIGCKPSAGEVRTKHHPQLDFAKWERLFPIETFEKHEGPRKYPTTDADSPLDLWKASGTWISSPGELCKIELVRRRVGQAKNLGPSVPVDIVLWQTAEPAQPYLTKLGGVPHREADKPWPTSIDGVPFTFIGQFCFLDSKDIVSKDLPGDVMLVFFKDYTSYFGDKEDVHIEWANRTLTKPLVAADCPKPQFRVPKLSGVLHRCNEYPESRDIFEQEGHDRCYLFPVTQSTKIGQETFFTQNDPRKGTQKLFCALNSLSPSSQWPFVDLESLPEHVREPDAPYGWEPYYMMFGDVGCLYFMIDDSGNISWEADCY